MRFQLTNRKLLKALLDYSTFLKILSAQVELIVLNDMKTYHDLSLKKKKKKKHFASIGLSNFPPGKGRFYYSGSVKAPWKEQQNT